MSSLRNAVQHKRWVRKPNLSCLIYVSPVIWVFIVTCEGRHDESSKSPTQGEATAANLRQERAKRRADDEVDGGKDG